MSKKYASIPDNQSINIAFLGCGNIAQKHSQLLNNRKGVNCFFASRTEAKAKNFSEKNKGSGYFGSYEAAIHSPEINVIFITTPPSSHFDLALQSIRAGKHVIVEKPPFLKASDFDILEKERTKTNVQLMVAENYFYKPLLQELRIVLQKDWIGEIKFLQFNATKTQKNDDWRNDLDLAGGGALYEGGIHWVNFIANLGFTIQSVTGFIPKSPNITSSQLDQSAQIIFEFKEGAIANLLYSWEINTLLFGLRLSRIYGTKGSITLESNGLFIFVRGKKWKLIFPGFADISGKKAMFDDFLKALRSGEAPRFDAQLARRDLAIIEEVYRGD